MGFDPSKCEVIWLMGFDPSKCEVIRFIKKRQPFHENHITHGHTLKFGKSRKNTLE